MQATALTWQQVVSYGSQASDSAETDGANPIAMANTSMLPHRVVLNFMLFSFVVEAVNWLRAPIPKLTAFIKFGDNECSDTQPMQIIVALFSMFRDL